MRFTISLKKNYQFLRVYKRGISYAGKYLVLYCLKNNCECVRLGITTSKKVGNSVVRNRIRRLLKENYRQFEEKISVGFDIVFVVRANDNVPTYYEIKREMKYLLKRLKLMNDKN